MRIPLVLIAAFALGGCAALMVGGGAAAGYQLGKDERAPAQVARDGATTATIKSKLVADPVVSAFNIDVDTYADRVTLRGSVGSFAARQRAGEIAAGVETARSVDNRIDVVSR